MQKPITHIFYRPDIDGLRAVAVLAVIGFHAFPNWVKGGFIGVDVFFVISGFLITQIILKDIQGNNFTYWNFYARRILRIFPALIAVLIPTFAFGWYVSLPDEFAQLTRHIAAGSAFISNFILMSEAGYFDNAAETKPLLHLWSLGVEQQYYLLWPIMLVLVMGIRSARRLWILSFVFILSFAANVILTMQNNSFAFYMLPPRFWELMAGGFLAYYRSTKKNAHKEVSSHLQYGTDILAILGLALIAGSTMALDSTMPFPAYAVILPVMGAALVIGAGMNSRINRYLIGNKLMAWIGIISYPLYLWHWPLLVFAKIASGDLLSVEMRLILIASSFALAAITYYGIERPLRRKRSERNAKILLALMVVLCGIAIAMGMMKFQPRHNVEGVTTLLEAAYDWDFPSVSAKRLFIPNLRAFEYRTNRIDEKVVYLGDSNLEQYAPRIAHITEKYPDKFRSAVFMGNQNDCNIVSEIFEAGGNCADALMAAEGYLKIHDVRALVLVVAGSKYLTNMAKQENIKRMENFIRMQLKVRKVYIVLNIPEGDSLNPREMFTGDRLSSLSIKPATHTSFDYSGFMERYAETRQKIVDMAKSTGAQIIDPLPFLCPEQVCPVFDTLDGRPLYKDRAHIRPFYAKKAAKFMDIPLHVE